ncbi:hypothetical protein BSKO_03343 [Bryopsis sp. KO-2023]|nr:hypothetical protein BSKO_03343 [Bryopsis sp. KO-2023]
MGDVTTLKRALDAEFTKGMKFLSKSHKQASQTEKQTRFRQLQKLGQIIEHYTCRLPFCESAPKLVQMGKHLIDAGEFEIAKQVCFDTVSRLGERPDGYASSPMLSVKTRTLFGTAICTSSLLLERDPFVRNVETVKGCVESLERFQQGVELAMLDPELYWLVVNGTVHIANVSRKMTERGFGKEVLKFVALAASVLEANIMFSAPKYLPWRVQLYREVCYCMEEAQYGDKIAPYIQGALSKLNELEDLQRFDPVPPSPDVVDARSKAKRALILLTVRYNKQGSTPAEVVSTLQTEFEKIEGLVENLLQSRDVEARKKTVEGLCALLDPILTDFIETLEKLEAEQNAGDENHSDEKQVEEEKATTIQDKILRMDEGFPPPLHMATLLAMLFEDQPEILNKLLKVGYRRCSMDADRFQTEGDFVCDKLRAAVEIVDGASKFLKSKDPSMLKDVSSALRKHEQIASACFPDTLLEISRSIWETAEALIDRPTPHTDSLFDTVIDASQAVFQVHEILDVDDALLRATVALKLATLLELAGDLYKAREILRKAKATVEKFRGESLLDLRNGEQARYQWITASKCQRNAESRDRVSELPATIQELGCVHLDLLSMLFRIELKVKERELLEACGKNMYEKAVLLMEMARFSKDRKKQEAILKESMNLLISAHELEEKLIEGASTREETKKARLSPLAPAIVSRTSTSVSLKFTPVKWRGGTPPSTFAVYAKSFGAGVSISMNSTAMEYPGTGHRVSLDSVVTIENLVPNDVYIFALAGFDAQGDVVGKLGDPSPQVHTLLPLPLYLCWSTLAILASTMGVTDVQRRAKEILYSNFVVTSPQRPLWEENPLDSLQVNRQNVLLATTAELRGFVQSTFSFLDIVSEDGRASRTTISSQEGNGSFISMTSHQLSLLKGVRSILLGMEISRYVCDDLLMAEGCVRLNNALLPVMSQKQKPPLLIKALATCYTILEDLQQRAKANTECLENQRQLACRALSSMLHFAADLCVDANEEKIGSHIRGLDFELFKQQDVSELKSYKEKISIEPDLHGLGSDAKERYSSGGDISFAILSELKNGDLMKLWDQLQTGDAKTSERYVEFGVRILEEGVQRGVVTMEIASKWATTLKEHVRSGLSVEWLSFESWSLQKSLEEEVANSAEETSPETDASEKEQETEKLRKATMLVAVVLLQKRLLTIFKRRAAVLRKRELAKVWFPWVARLNSIIGKMKMSSVWGSLGNTAKEQQSPNEEQTLQVQQALLAFANAGELSSRSGSWTEMLAMLHQFWNCGRKVLARCGEMLAPVAKADWKKLEESPERWTIEACAPNAGRSVLTLALSVLRMLQMKRDAFEGKGVPESVGNHDSDLSTSMSDVPQELWFGKSDDDGLDMEWILKFIVVTLNILKAMERWDGLIKARILPKI